jgi:TDG/mug DNA glycosylase family protein
MRDRKHKPTVEQVRAARGKRLPDILAEHLDVVFCGVNPGLYSAAVGWHFARPGNRFWMALYESGFTDRQLEPWEQRELLRFGCGLTNLVSRATAVAAELERKELRRGSGILKRKLARYRPGHLVVLGIGAYRNAFDRPTAEPGPQDERMEGAKVWLLPNPSGLNAHYRPRDFAVMLEPLRQEVRGK